MKNYSTKFSRMLKGDTFLIYLPKKGIYLNYTKELQIEKALFYGGMFDYFMELKPPYNKNSTYYVQKKETLKIVLTEKKFKGFLTESIEDLLEQRKMAYESFM